MQARNHHREASTVTALIAAELGFRRTVSLDGDLFRGTCPECGSDEALLWDYRTGRPDDAWLCVRCGAHGTVFHLHRLARSAASGWLVGDTGVRPSLVTSWPITVRGREQWLAAAGD